MVDAGLAKDGHPDAYLALNPSWIVWILPALGIAKLVGSIATLKARDAAGIGDGSRRPASLFTDAVRQVS
jgi:hypothetical protein